MTQPTKQPSQRIATIAWCVSFATLSLTVLVPVWSVYWLPYQDLSAHLDLFDIIQRYHDDATHYDETYVIQWAARPNVATPLLAKLAAPLFDARTFAKLLLSFYLIGLPATMSVAARMLGRSPWLGLIGFGLLHNRMLALGLINYLVALPLVPLIIALAIRWLNNKRPREGIALTVLLNLTFFVHGLAWAIMMAVVGTLVLWQWLRKGPTFVPTLPVALGICAAVPTLMDRVLNPATGGLGPDWSNLKHRLYLLHRDGMSFHQGWIDEVFALVLGLGLLMLLLSHMRGAKDTSEHTGSLAVTFLTLVVLFFALPVDLSLFQVVSGRVVIVALIVLVLVPPVRRLDANLTTLPVLVFVLGCVTAYQVWVGMELRRFDRDVITPLRDVLEPLPDGSMIGRIGEIDQARFEGAMYHITRGLHAVINGGTSDESFAAAPTTIVKYRVNGLPPRTAHGNWEQADRARIDHVIVRSTTTPTWLTRHPALTLRQKAGGWSSYDLRKTTLPKHHRLYGGRGGRRNAAICTYPSHVSGLYVRVLRRGVIAGVEVQCSDEVTRRVGSWQGLGGFRVRLSCPDGEHVVGLHGETTQVEVSRLGIVCAASQDGEHTIVPAVGGRGAGRFDIHCGERRRFMGVRVKTGRWLDAIGMWCQRERKSRKSP